MLLKNLCLALVCVLCSVTFADHADKDRSTPINTLLDLIHPIEGQPLPEMTIDEEEQQWLLVKLWSIDCSICRAQVPVISALHQDRTNINQADEKQKAYQLSVLGISIDAETRQSEIANYLQKNQPTYPNVIAENIAIAQWFGSLAQEPFRGTPTYLLFDPYGDLAAIQTSILKPDSLDKFISRYTKL